MCLASRHSPSHFEEIMKKLPNTVIMWRVVRTTRNPKTRRKELFGVIRWFGIHEGWNVAPKNEYPRTTGVDGDGFHCFLKRSDARVVAQLAQRNVENGLSTTFSVRKTIVRKRDILHLGVTTWYYGVMTLNYQTAIVRRMNLRPSKEGR